MSNDQKPPSSFWNRGPQNQDDEVTDINSGPDQYGHQPPYPQPPYGGQPQPPYGGQPPQPPYGGQPQQPPYGGQPQQPPYGGQPQQPPYGGQPQQPPYGGQPQQPPYGGQPQQPPYGGQPQQPPYGGQPQQQPPYGGQPQQPYNPGHSEQATELPSYPPPNNPYPQQPYPQQPYPQQGYGRVAQDPDNFTVLSDQSEDVIHPIGYLFIKRPQERRGFTYRINGGCTIGRGSTSTLVINDNQVSDIHARIRLEEAPNAEPIFWISDLGSRNGTKLNGEKIEGRDQLNDGDEVTIGKSVLVFKVLKD